MGWFYGFQWPLAVNERGDLLAFGLTLGNVDDRRPVPRPVHRPFGRLVGDSGSISQPLAEQRLVEHGIHLITKLQKNMRNRLLTRADTLLPRTRVLIEGAND